MCTTNRYLFLFGLVDLSSFFRDNRTDRLQQYEVDTAVRVTLGCGCGHDNMDSSLGQTQKIDRSRDLTMDRTRVKGELEGWQPCLSSCRDCLREPAFFFFLIKTAACSRQDYVRVEQISTEYVPLAVPSNNRPKGERRKRREKQTQKNGDRVFLVCLPCWCIYICTLFAACCPSCYDSFISDQWFVWVLLFARSKLDALFADSIKERYSSSSSKCTSSVTAAAVRTCILIV